MVGKRRIIPFGSNIRALLLILLCTGMILAACSSQPAAPSSEPDPSTEETGSTSTEDVQTPPDPVEIRVAWGAVPQPPYLGQMLSLHEMAREGILAETRHFSTLEVGMRALIGGEIDLMFVAPGTSISARLEGADVIGLMTVLGNEWQLAARSEFQTLADLAGRTVAVHSPTSQSTVFTENVLRQENIDAEIIYLPGSPARASALLEGETDAAALFMTDIIRLDQQSPGQFHVVRNFNDDFPYVPALLAVARGDWVKDNLDVATRVVKGILSTYRKIAEDPDWAIQQAPLFFAQEDPALIEAMVPVYVESGFWPTDGGLDEEIAQQLLDFMVDFFVQSGDIQEPPAEMRTWESFFDLQPLQQALEELDG